jgi:hypothetical protein
MIIHFIAFLFFVFAFQTLAYLKDFNFIFSPSQSMSRLNIPQRFYADMEFIAQIGNLGLLAGYVISWTISSKRNWHWANSVIVFVLLFVLKNFVLTHWGYYANVVIRPGGPFNIYSMWGHIVLGIVLLGIGLALLFSKKVISYIEASKPEVKQPVKKGKARA